MVLLVSLLILFLVCVLIDIMDKDKEKKRGRPSMDEKKKKQKTSKVSLDEMVSKVSKNLNSSFVYHNDWLQEVLPQNLEDLYKLRVELEPNSSVMPLSEMDDIIAENLKYLNNNDELFSKIHKSFQDFVNDDMDDVVLTLLENFADKIKILIEIRKEKVGAIIRKSIGFKMFPELNINKANEDEDEDKNED